MSFPGDLIQNHHITTMWKATNVVVAFFCIELASSKYLLVELDKTDKIKVNSRAIKNGNSVPFCDELSKEILEKGIQCQSPIGINSVL